MEDVFKRRYGREFKEEAVLQVVEQGRTVLEVSKLLGVSDNSIYKWIKAYKEDPVTAFPGKGYLKPEAEEMRRLRKQLSDMTEERDILKKAVAIFSKVPNRNTCL